MRLAEYRERLELTIRCLGDPRRSPDQSRERRAVDLPKFAAWAQSVGWEELPAELQTLVPSAVEGSTEKRPPRYTEKEFDRVKEAYDRRASKGAKVTIRSLRDETLVTRPKIAAMMSRLKSGRSVRNS